MNAEREGGLIDDTYFAEEIVDGLRAFCVPEVGNHDERHFALPFDNAATHSSKTLTEKMTFSRFTRLKHALHSLYGALCNSGVLHRHLSGSGIRHISQTTFEIERQAGLASIRKFST
jgi:hypothetical protein